MVDKYSWLQGFAKRDDGVEVRCSHYASNYTTKPMRETLAQSFRGAVQAV